MNLRKYLLIPAILSLPLIFLSASVMAQGDFARETLQGIPGVHVVVDMSLPSDLSAPGLSEQIQSDLEARLEMMGIDVLSRNKLEQTAQRPILLARIDLVKPENAYVCFILLQLYQQVHLTEKPQDRVYPAVTWSSDGVTGIFSALDSIRGVVLEELNQFVQDYQTAKQPE
ncbi:MAG: hypothetical protein PVG99_11720 [Desulfobacteraceae bacterium]|jgi:hypothetical protein